MNKIHGNDPFWFENVENRPHPWPGLQWCTTVAVVEDVAATRRLYLDVLSFVAIYDKVSPTEPEKLVTSRLRYRGSNILLVAEGLGYEGTAPAKSGIAPSVTFYHYVDDVERTYQAATEAGFEGVRAPSEMPWGDLCARVRCPQGYLWDLASKIA